MKNRNIKYLIRNNFLVTASLFIPIEVLYYNSIGLSTSEIALLSLSISLFIAVLEIPTGLLSDKLTKKTILIFSNVAFVCSMLVLFLTENFYLILLANLFEGLGWSLASGNNESILHESCDEEEFKTELSRYYEYSFAALLVSNIAVIILFSIISTLKVAIGATLVIRLISLILSFSITSTSKDRTEATSSKNILKSVINIIANNKSIALIEALNRLTFFIPIIYQLKLLQLGYGDNSILVINLLLFLVMYLSQKSYSINDKNKFNIKNLTLIQVLGIVLLISNNLIILLIGLFCIYATIPLKNQLLSETKHELAENTNRSSLLSGYSLVTLIISTIVFAIIAYISEINIAISLISLSALIIFSLLIFQLKINVKTAKGH